MMPPMTSAQSTSVVRKCGQSSSRCAMDCVSSAYIAVSAALSVGVAMPLTSEPMATTGANSSHLATHKALPRFFDFGSFFRSTVESPVEAATMPPRRK